MKCLIKKMHQYKMNNINKNKLISLNMIIILMAKKELKILKKDLTLMNNIQHSFTKIKLLEFSIKTMNNFQMSSIIKWMMNNWIWQITTYNMLIGYIKYITIQKKKTLKNKLNNTQINPIEQILTIFLQLKKLIITITSNMTMMNTFNYKFKIRFTQKCISIYMID